MALSNPHGDKITIRPAYIATSPTTLTVKQKYWSWFKNTGRGFTVTNSADDSLLFALSTKSWGKHRFLEDKEGNSLFELQRNWTKRKDAWVLQDRDGNVILNVRLRWSKVHMNLEVEWQSPSPSGESRDVDVRVKGGDVWHEKLQATAGDTPIMAIRCSNTIGGILSSYKVTPPVWEVMVGEGVDLTLVSLLYLMLSFNTES